MKKNAKSVRVGVIDVGPLIAFEKSQAQLSSEIPRGTSNCPPPPTPMPSVWYHHPENLGPVDWKNWTGKPCQSRGLINHGKTNSCYFNSVLQALAYCPPLVQNMFNHLHSSKCVRKQKGVECAMCEFEVFVKELFDPSSKHPLPTPRFVYRLLQDKKLQLGRQQCAHEFLFHLFEWIGTYDLHPALQADNLSHRLPWVDSGTSYLAQLFTGIFRILRVCANCENREYNFQPFRELIVPIHPSLDFNKSFQSMVEPEIMKDAKCSNCGSKQQKNSYTRIAKIPNILTVTLQRSSWSSYLSMPTKIGGSIECPLSLDVSPMIVEEQQNKKNFEYSLVAAVSHHGFAEGGHYVAFGKRPVHGGFVEIDDESVSPAHYPKGQSLDMNAFLLFYVKKSKDELNDSIPKELNLYSEKTNKDEANLRLVVEVSYEEKEERMQETEVVISPMPSSNSAAGSEFASEVVISPMPSSNSAAGSEYSSSNSSKKNKKSRETASLYASKLKTFDRMRPEKKQLKKRRLLMFHGKKRVVQENKLESQFSGLKVGMWDEDSSDGEDNNLGTSTTSTMSSLLKDIHPPEKQRDSYDKDFDMGKTKRVRKKAAAVNLNNEMNKVEAMTAVETTY